jgi:Protein of unknown function with HXXEE motif
MKWLFAGFLAASALHMAEEYFYPGGFMDVMKRLNPSFAPFVTVPMAIVVNGLQLVLCVVALAVGERSTILGISVAGLLFLNGLVHIGGCIKARGYSPGVVTGVALYLPLSAYAYAASVGSGKLTAAGVTVSLALGLAYQVIPIGYLALVSALRRRWA